MCVLIPMQKKIPQQRADVPNDIRHSGIYQGNLIGKTLGGYTIRRKVGDGGSSRVFEAYRLDRKVAVKIANDERKNKFLENEQKILSKIKTDKVPSIIDAGIYDDKKFIVTDFFDGKTVAELILENGYLDWKTARNLMIELCDALFFVHQSGVVHRDIKPSNAIISKFGLKLIDFGISKLISDCNLSSIRTLDVTPSYTSPEVASGQLYDYRSDIYSSGVMLYEMITGRIPFTANKPDEVLFKQIYFIPDLPSQVLNCVVESEYIIMKCLEKNPSKRYQDVLELRRTLLEQIEGTYSIRIAKTKSSISDNPTIKAKVV